MRNDGVTFEAAGKSRTLRFSINALCDLEDQTGLGVTELVEQLQSKPKMTFIRVCFWAGLREHDPDLNLASAGNVVEALGLAEAAKILGQAVASAFPTPMEKEGDQNPPKPQTGTGINT